tara:strand:+ start:69 stop:350 length:282 start_codon:yes stop_codon:yes gene_type:complete
MTRQKKSRSKAGRVPLSDMVEVEVRPNRTSQSKLKPQQRSGYLDSLQKEAQQQALAKRKNRLKSDPADVAARSLEVIAQKNAVDENDPVDDAS